MTTLIVTVALPFIFCCMIAEYYFARHNNRSTYTLKGFLENLQHAIARQALDIFFRAVFVACYIYLYTQFRIADVSLHWTSWLLVFLVHDFLEYWIHRALHHFHLLWGMHLVHHAAEEMNLSVSLRHPWFITLIITFPLYLFAFAGVSPWMLLTISTVCHVASFWTHSSEVPKLGLLERILITPSLHRVHHARNVQYLDKNFGQTLSIWDQLFGTYVEEKEKPVYGLTLPHHNENPLWENVYYYAFFARILRKTKGWKSKIRLFFAGISRPGEQFSKEELVTLMKEITENKSVPVCYCTRSNKINALIVVSCSMGLTMLMMNRESFWGIGEKILCTAFILGLLVMNGTIFLKSLQKH